MKNALWEHNGQCVCVPNLHIVQTIDLPSFPFRRHKASVVLQSLPTQELFGHCVYETLKMWVLISLVVGFYISWIVIDTSSQHGVMLHVENS